MQNNDSSAAIAPLTHAAYAHVDAVASQADGYEGSAPWWHGWAVREAFEAGAEWQRSQAVENTRIRNAFANATFSDWMQVKFWGMPFPVAAALTAFGLLALALLNLLR